MTYAEKLTNPKWQRRRLQIFNRDNFTCTKCKCDTVTLQVHHLDYFNGIEPWDYPDDMLTTLCEICHKEEQSRGKHEKYVLTSLKMNGFLAYDLLSLSAMIDTNKEFVQYLKKLLRKK